MRLACSLGPAWAEVASCVNSSTAPVSARRAPPERTCALFSLTFMALVNSLNCSEARSGLYVPSPPSRMSQAGDVADRRHSRRLLVCADHCAANCEGGHGVPAFARLPSSAMGTTGASVVDRRRHPLETF